MFNSLYTRNEIFSFLYALICNFLVGCIKELSNRVQESIPQYRRLLIKSLVDAEQKHEKYIQSTRNSSVCDMLSTYSIPFVGNKKISLHSPIVFYSFSIFINSWRQQQQQKIPTLLLYFFFPSLRLSFSLSHFFCFKWFDASYYNKKDFFFNCTKKLFFLFSFLYLLFETVQCVL